MTLRGYIMGPIFQRIALGHDEFANYTTQSVSRKLNCCKYEIQTDT